MKKNTSNIVKSLLLFIAAFPIAGVLVFQIQQKVVQYRMLDDLENKHLQTIALHQNDFRWEKPEKEIWVNGQLFDIKSYTVTNENYVFTGLYDYEESRLVSILEQKQNNTQGNDGDLDLLFQLLQNIFFLQQRDSNQNQQRRLLNFSPFLCTIPQVFLAHEIEPPKYIA